MRIEFVANLHDKNNITPDLIKDEVEAVGYDAEFIEKATNVGLIPSNRGNGIDDEVNTLIKED